MNFGECIKGLQESSRVRKEYAADKNKAHSIPGYILHRTVGLLCFRLWAMCNLPQKFEKGSEDVQEVGIGVFSYLFQEAQHMASAWC